MELREATRDDLPAIAAVNLAAAQAAFGHIGPVERLEARPEDWEPRLAAADWARVAVDEDGRVVGFAFTGGCELQFFFTHPDVWGGGVGRALLGAAEESIRARGCDEAFLFTEERNERAVAVYARAGWHAEPGGPVREREWLGVQLREPRLRKRL